jgi:anaphase-promoting complex subunit 6
MGNGDATSSAAAAEGTQHSPFLQGLLRFSPNNSATVAHQRPVLHHHLSPVAGRDSSSVTNAGHQRFWQQEPTTTAATGTTTGRDARAAQPKHAEKVPGTVVDGVPVDHLRALAKQAILQSPDTACFFSRILYAKTGTSEDALLLAQAHVAAGQITACLRILDDASLILEQQTAWWEAVLTACAALTAKEDWATLQEMLDDICRLPDGETRSLAAAPPLEDDDALGWATLKRSISENSSCDSEAIHPLAHICWYRGKALAEQGCGQRAVVCWKLALKMDCQCVAAWDCLLDKNLLTAAQAHELVTRELEFSEDQQWLRSLYLARIEVTPQETGHVQETTGGNKLSDAFAAMHGAGLDASSIQLTSPMQILQTPGMNSTAMDAEIENTGQPKKSERQSSTMLCEIDKAFDDLCQKHKLEKAPQVLAMAARRAYRRYDWKTALQYCEDLAQLDPAVTEAAYCYVAVLTVLGRKRVLFRLAHEWVEASPKSAEAWFAVGAYYYTIQRYHMAQRHFCRATRLDPTCMEAWIAFGCSFAACDESDQALASFRAAQRLSPGEHTSLMYMGMEYVRTNHLVLAHYFLHAALAASGGDPLCLHELGVLAAAKGEHKDAINWFRRALAAAVGGDDSLHESIELCHDTYWEPTLFNLGHSYRKTRQFELAAACYGRCVALCPDKFSAYSALAFAKLLLGDADGAISQSHQALSIKPDDPFSTEVLNRALAEQATSSALFDSTEKAALSQFGKHQSPLRFASGQPSPVSERSQKEDSMMSEEMESDVDMSGGS